MPSASPLGVVVTGASVAWAVGASAGTDILSTFLTNDLPKTFTLNATGGTNDTTPFTQAGARKYAKSLREARWTIQAYLGTPQDGYLGNIAFAGAEYPYNFKSYRMSIKRDVVDTTAFAAINGWRSFSPGLYNWSATATAFMDSATALTPPLMTATSAEPQVATFTVYSASGTPKTLVGSVFTTSVTANVAQGEAATAEITLMGNDTLVATGANSNALWADDATATKNLPAQIVTDGKLTLTATSGQAYNGLAIWENVDIDVTVGNNIVVTIGGRFSQSIAANTMKVGSSAWT